MILPGRDEFGDLCLTYILEDKKPVACRDPLKWSAWFEQADRTVALNLITNKVEVSTVFLGMMDFQGRLFETMIFGATPFNHEYQERYYTWDEAVEGHLRAIEMMKQCLWQRLRKRKKQTKKIQAKTFKWKSGERIVMRMV